MSTALMLQYTSKPGSSRRCVLGTSERPFKFRALLKVRLGILDIASRPPTTFLFWLYSSYGSTGSTKIENMNDRGRYVTVLYCTVQQWAKLYILKENEKQKKIKMKL